MSVLKILVILLFLPYVCLFPGQVLAVDFEVTGNGSESSSSVQVANTQATQVVQSNEATVTNTVSQTANTGDNTANKNQAAETSVITGDIQNKTSITNSTNSNVSETGCCNGQTGSASITANGSQTANTIKVETQTTDLTVAKNTATINNTIIMNATTGKNEVSENTGAVSISTGSIKATAGITNTGINTTYITGGTSTTKINTKISGNAIGSTNGIEVNSHNSSSVSVLNIASVSNTIFQNFSTGNNSANGNNGPVSITTGDILASTQIVNTDINSNHSLGSCIECKSTPPTTPPVTDPGDPADPSPSVGRGGSSDVLSAASAAAANSAAQVLGAMLPATGNSNMLTIYFLNTFLLLTGIYLKIRNSHAPLVITLEILM